MILNYVGTKDDLFAKLDHFTAGSPVARHFTKAAYVGICALMWLTVWRFYAEQRHVNNHYLIAGGVALALSFALPWLYTQYQKSFFASVLNDKSVQGLVGDTRIEVSDEGVAEYRGVSTVKMPWSIIRQVMITGSYYFVVMAPLVIILVPFRAFETAQDRQAFETLVNDRIGQAQITTWGGPSMKMVVLARALSWVTLAGSIVVPILAVALWFTLPSELLLKDFDSKEPLSLIYRSIGAVVSLPSALVLSWGLLSLRRAFVSAANNEPLSQEALQGLKGFAWCNLALILLDILKTSAAHMLLWHHVHGNYSLSIGMGTPEAGRAFIALLLLFLAMVFASAQRYKEETDSFL